jgi:DNA-directed RNA polymerase subunit H (RpoH/RPB5)
MNYLKKLLSGLTSKPNSNEQGLEANEGKPKKTIFDFFTIDLKALPDENFVQAEEIENESGQIVQIYRRSLTKKECGIFDTVEVRIIGGIDINISFIAFDIRTVNRSALKMLVDDLYLIYGNDASDKGKFTAQDQEDFSDPEFYSPVIRNWGNKNSYPVILSREESSIELAIWGINK